MFVRVWAGGGRDLVTMLVSTISFLMYISVVMDCVTIRVLNPYPANAENRVSSQILPANSGLADGFFFVTVHP